jgi:hypothetical protein
MSSSSKAGLFSAVVLIGVCGLLVTHFIDSLWTTSIDVALHYALVSRLSEHWQLPTNDDPSLEEMNIYPRYSHRLAAISDKLIGSPLGGMQFITMLSLSALWSAFAIMFLALPRRMRWMALGALSALLLANRFLIHLELFGGEILGNYFYPQLVAQALAIAAIACVLWMDKAGMNPIIGYLILGASVPVIQQFHLLPALEVLATLALLMLYNLLDVRNEHRWPVFGIGLLAIVASAALTVLSPVFKSMLSISETHGVLQLNYTPNLIALAIECGIVIVFSTLLLWQWKRLGPADARNNALVLKYIGLLGLAVSALCLLQIFIVQFGYGSEYASKKYAFGLNTVLVLDLLLLPILLLARIRALLLTSPGEPLRGPAILFQPLFPGLFVFMAVFAILPSPSTKVIALSNVVSVERFVRDHGGSARISSKYDYAIGLFPGRRNFDYLITIGALKTPRVDNADDILSGYPPSKPRRIGRIFTRVGSKPWDVPDCRQYVSPDGLAILDGQCVLTRIGASGAGTSP